MCHTPSLRRLLGALAITSTALAEGVSAQAAIDPNVAPRAAALEREGQRQSAVDLLGRYLATAPDDGRAWFQLGRFYLYDARDWHRQGHVGDPDGRLYLDFAATALEQSARLAVDSGVVFGGFAELERALLLLEDSGWTVARSARARGAPPLPGYLVELGDNLLRSCPPGGVLITGDDLEALSVWFGGRNLPTSEVVPLRPDLYATDSLYRRRIAAAIGADPGLPIQGALGAVAARRPVCLSPRADSAAAPRLGWTAVRLVRVGGGAGTRPRDGEATALSVTELVAASLEGPSPWLRDVRGVYERAAAHNTLLCRVLRPVGDPPPPACRH